MLQLVAVNNPPAMLLFDTHRLEVTVLGPSQHAIDVLELVPPGLALMPSNSNR